MMNDISGASSGPGSREPDPSVPALRASIPRAGPERIELSEFHKRLYAQGVRGREHAAFICPVCGTVQSMASLVAAGLTPEQAETKIGFSCEGRITRAGPWPRNASPARKLVRGCDWSLGGLFTIHKLEVDQDGKIHPLFELASPEQAAELAQGIETRSAKTEGLGPQDESPVTKSCAQGPAS